MGGVVHLFDLSQLAGKNHWSTALQMDLCLPAQAIRGQTQSQKQEPEERMEEVSVEQWVPDLWELHGEQGRAPSVRYHVEVRSQLGRRRLMLFGPGPGRAGLAIGPA